MDNEKETSAELTGFETRLRGLESLIEKAMQQHANLTLNINFYDGAKIGQHIDRTDTSNVWMGTEGSVEVKKTNMLNNKEELTAEQLRDGIAACQELFWGKSCLAIIYCVCRDSCGYGGSVSQFERELGTLGLDCPPGTITNALRNNPFMKLPVGKWKQQGVKERVMRVVECFQDAINRPMT